MSRLKRREIPAYEEQVTIWRKKQQIIEAKRKVFRDAIGLENPRPVRPHVQPCMDEKMLLLLMKDGVRKYNLIINHRQPYQYTVDRLHMYVDDINDRNKKAELLVASLDRDDNGNATPNNDDHTVTAIASGSDTLRNARRHRMAARVSYCVLCNRVRHLLDDTHVYVCI